VYNHEIYFESHEEYFVEMANHLAQTKYKDMSVEDMNKPYSWNSADPTWASKVNSIMSSFSK
jgi:hypothetical protein